MPMLRSESEERIAQRSAELVIAAIEARGLMEPTYPERMSTKDIADMKGCLPVTVQRNWHEWQLRLLGKGRHGQMHFSGLSVQRHIERESGYKRYGNGTKRINIT